ncbi:MAG TPA: glycosyl transferase family protein [Magnetospirillum sp.]|nr:glycosyl transferase family protein [Magnetospirillum sp.]
MTQEHPFAQYVRLLGKGPNLSRPLTQDEARAAMAMVLRGEVEPVQLGAFLCLLRVKTETPEEAAGLAQAIRDSVTPPPGLKVDVDWASYAGKSRRLPYYLLAALALAQSGVSVFMHGAEGHTAGRVYTSQALAALGVPVATSLEQAAAQLRESRFAYMTLEHLSPPLHAIMQLKALLGLRSPIHTVARMVNPLRAAFSINGVTHPPYLPVHQQGARLLGDSASAAFKGDGGEVERRPEKPCEVWALADGQPLREEWPALVSGTREHEESLDLARLRALWTGAEQDPVADAAIAGTIAIVLRYSGRAAGVAEAEAKGRAVWSERDRTRSV